jgi:hypothetical protein
MRLRYACSALLTIGLGTVLVCAGTRPGSACANIAQVLFWLMIVLVPAGIAFWPSCRPARGAARDLPERDWTGRISFRPVPRLRRAAGAGERTL